MAARSTGWAMLARPRSRRRRTSRWSPTPRPCAPGCRSCTSSTASAPPTRSRRSSLLDRRRPARPDPTTTTSLAHRSRGLTPMHPVLRGTAQNPDVFFQAREAVQPLLRRRARRSSRQAMDELAERTGPAVPARSTTYGHPDAERVVVAHGLRRRRGRSETVEELVAGGEKVGVLKVRLYRPFPAEQLSRRAAGLGHAVRRPRPHQGAGRDRRAAAPRRAGGPRRGLAGRATRRRDHRRPVRPARQGVHAVHGQGASSTSWPSDDPKPPVHGGHRRRRHPPVAPGRPDLPASRPTTCPAVFFGLGSRRHRRGEQELDQDHRRGHRRPRPGLLRLRLEEVRLDDRLAPAVRARADPLDLPGRAGRLRRRATSSGCWSR